MPTPEIPKENPAEKAQETVRLKEQLATLQERLKTANQTDAQAIREHMGTLQAKIDATSARKDVLQSLQEGYESMRQRVNAFVQPNTAPTAPAEAQAPQAAPEQGSMFGFKMPGWLNWIASGAASASGAVGTATWAAGGAIGRFGKRAWSSFMVSIDKIMPTWASPVITPFLGGLIDKAREDLTLMDAEDGLTNAMRALSQKDKQPYVLEWDAIAWERWRPAYETAVARDPRLSARTFVERYVKTKLGVMTPDQIRALKTLNDIEAPAGSATPNVTIAAPNVPLQAPNTLQGAPGNLPDYGLNGFVNGMEKELTDGMAVIYKNALNDPVPYITIKRDEIIVRGDRYKVSLKGDVKVFFKPVIIDGHLRKSELIYRGTKNGFTDSQKIENIEDMASVATKTVTPSMELEFTRQIL